MPMMNSKTARNTPKRALVFILMDSDDNETHEAKRLQTVILAQMNHYDKITN